MHRFRVTVEVARPPHVVRDWWLDLPDRYEAEDPREQPHRIITVDQEQGERHLLTYWRGPFGKELEVPEVLYEHGPDAWSFDLVFPFGVDQRDDFLLVETDGGRGTRIEIDVTLSARTMGGRVLLPLFKLFAKRNYPRTWEQAARLCEEATADEAGMS